MRHAATTRERVASVQTFGRYKAQFNPLPQRRCALSESELDRFHSAADRWLVAVEETRVSDTSVLGFGTRGGEAVVLKVVGRGLDEWGAGSITAAFRGRGMVRVLEQEPGALLLERLRPGIPLVGLVLEGKDQAATQVLVHVIQSMHEVPSTWPAATTLSQLGAAFERYIESGDNQIDPELVWDARSRYLRLCRTQRGPRLLHGDLQHSNVLFDDRRGWIAIDPKGLNGELEYEVGAMFRNPKEAPDLYPQPSTIERRFKVLSSELELDGARALEWLYTQAVLSAVWMIEDGRAPEEATIRLAVAARDLLG